MGYDPGEGCLWGRTSQIGKETYKMDDKFTNSGKAPSGPLQWST